jgi:hypothetical protein
MDSNFNNSRYVNIEECSKNWYFYDEEIRVPSEDIKNIKPLSVGYSGLLWEQYISNRNRHFMLLDSDDKLSLLEKQDYNWLDDWNNGTYENFTNYLSRNLPYKQCDTIIVFWSKESAVETNWSIFIKHWANFFFDDEGVALVNTMNETTLVFCSYGVLLKGKRTSEL